MIKNQRFIFAFTDLRKNFDEFFFEFMYEYVFEFYKLSGSFLDTKDTKVFCVFFVLFNLKTKDT